MSKKLNCVVSVLFALVLLVSSAFADLSNYINVPGLNFGFNSYQQDNGQMTFSSNLSTVDLIENASVSVSRDSQNPLRGWVSFNFWGVVGVPAVEKDWESSSMRLNFRGLNANTNAGVGAYHEIIDWTYPVGGGEGTPIYGNWMSSASCSATLSGISFLDSDGGYDEYTYNDDGGKGFASDLLRNSITNFSAWAQFRVQFDNTTVAAIYSGMKPMQVSAIPEPATLAVLGLGSLLLRRHRRSK